LENDVYGSLNKFSSKIPKGFVRGAPEQEGSSWIYSYHDAGFDLFSLQPDDYDSLPQHIHARFLHYKRYVAGASELVVGRVNMSRRDMKRLHVASEADKLAFLKQNPSSSFGFIARRPSDELDPEMYWLQRGSDAVCYERERRGAPWTTYEVYDFLSEPFPPHQNRLEGGKIVPPEQVQRYIELAERFYKTYSLPQGGPS
jgi:hypothetical protein